MMMIDAINNNQSNTYNLFGPRPLSGTTTADTLLPIYSSPFTIPDLDNTLPVSRKRSRDSLYMSPSSFSDLYRSLAVDNCGSCTFLGEDISSQIQQQQFEIDQFIARHNEKLRAEIEEKRRRNSRRLKAALDEGITRIFRAKEEEITKMMKLNWALEEKLKSLCIENQIWRELAQTNEATANSLRSNLKQALEQLVDSSYGPTVRETDDAESCCESNNKDDVNTLTEEESNRLCKSCWKCESSVLLLPCRHLCLCTGCASSVHICPICQSSKNISVHVHMS